MALIICRECGKKISEFANSCPNCGCPMLKNQATINDGIPLQDNELNSIEANDFNSVDEYYEHDEAKEKIVIENMTYSDKKKARNIRLLIASMFLIVFIILVIIPLTNYDNVVGNWVTGVWENALTGIGGVSNQEYNKMINGYLGREATQDDRDKIMGYLMMGRLPTDLYDYLFNKLILRHLLPYFIPAIISLLLSVTLFIKSKKYILVKKP